MLYIKTTRYNLNSNIRDEDIQPVKSDSVQDTMYCVLKGIASDLNDKYESYGSLESVKNDMTKIEIFKDEALEELVAEKTLRDVDVAEELWKF